MLARGSINETGFRTLMSGYLLDLTLIYIPSPFPGANQATAELVQGSLGPKFSAQFLTNRSEFQ